MNVLKTPFVNWLLGCFFGLGIGAALGSHILASRIDAMTHAMSIERQNLQRETANVRAQLTETEARVVSCETTQVSTAKLAGDQAKRDEEMKAFYARSYVSIYEIDDSDAPPASSAAVQALELLRPGLGKAMARYSTQQGATPGWDPRLKLRWVIPGIMPGQFHPLVQPAGSRTVFGFLPGVDPWDKPEQRTEQQ